MPLNHIHRKLSSGYKLHKSQEKNQPSYVHGRQQTAKNEKELETPTQVVGI